MMRALVALLAITSVSGQVEDTPGCAIDTIRAVDDLTDGVLYIFASIARCDPDLGDQVRCVVDISAAIDSVNKMVDIIVKAVDKCGEITTAKPQCGIAIGELTRSMADLTSASAGIVAKCVSSVPPPPAPVVPAPATPCATQGPPPAAPAAPAVPAVPPPVASPCATQAPPRKLTVTIDHLSTVGQCVINVKESMKSVFKIVQRAKVVAKPSENMTSPLGEAHDAVKLAGALVGLAEYIAGAIGHCSADPTHAKNGQCAEMTFRLTHASAAAGAAATRMVETCEPTPTERLYGLTDMKAVTSPTTNSLTMALTALLPITAVVAFVGGKRFGKARSLQPIADDEEEMLVAAE